MPVRPSREVVKEDRRCRKCGYNLRGLKMGDRCPECGTAVSEVARKKDRYADNMTESPMWYLVVVACGSVAMGLALFGSIALMIAERSASAGWNPLSPLMVAVAGGLIAVVWVAGVWLATMKRTHGEHTIRDVILDSRTLRWVTRGVQLFLPLAIGLRYAATATCADWIGVLAGVTTLGWLYGIAPLCVYLGSLADWAGDTNAGDRLRASAWALAVMGTLALVMGLVLAAPVPFKLLLTLVLVVCLLGVGAGVLMFVAGVIQLTVNSVWAVQNSGEARAREARLAEKRRQQVERDMARDRERAARVAKQMSAMDAAAKTPSEEDAPIPIERAGEPRDEVDRGLDGALGREPEAEEALPGPETPVEPYRPRPRGEHVIAPTSDGTGYDLEPEDDGSRR
jgi:hypothetical protein